MPDDPWPPGIPILEFVRWIDETSVPGVRILSHGKVATRADEIEYADAIARARRWCAANPAKAGTGDFGDEA